MASKFDKLIEKADHKVEEVIDQITGKDSEEDAEQSQEYYQPRLPEQIKEGGKIVLTRGQAEEAEQQPEG